MKIEAIQLDFMSNLTGDLDLSDHELTSFITQSNRKSSDIGGAIGRLMKAKRYHEVANKLSEELLNTRMENEKLKEKLKIMQGAG